MGFAGVDGTSSMIFLLSGRSLTGTICHGRGEKRASSDAARSTPTKGQCRTAWPTPLAGRGPEAAPNFKSP